MSPLTFPEAIFRAKLTLIFAMVPVPPTEPESVACEVLEYKERRWEGEKTFCHTSSCEHRRLRGQP